MHPCILPPVHPGRNRKTTGKVQAIISSAWFFSERSPYITCPLIGVKGGKTNTVGCKRLSPVSSRVIFVFLWLILVSSKFVMIGYDTCNWKHKHYRQQLGQLPVIWKTCRWGGTVVFRMSMVYSVLGEQQWTRVIAPTLEGITETPLLLPHPTETQTLPGTFTFFSPLMRKQGQSSLRTCHMPKLFQRELHLLDK